MLIKNLGDVPLNIKESKTLSKFLEENYTPWKWNGEEWIKEPIRKIETSNNEVSKWLKTLKIL